MEVPLKTLVNTRAPLADRLPRPRHDAPHTAPALSLHCPPQTTYDTNYAHHPDAAAGARGTPPGATAPGPTAAGPVTQSSATWESESHAATRLVQPGQCLDFYSRVRRLERVEDDRRGALTGNLQRTVDIRQHRATDARLRPPSVGRYVQADPVHATDLARREKGESVTLNYLDLVDCTHRSTATEYGAGFHDAPLTRLPDASLPQDLHTQSKAVTHMATSRDLFRGSAKYTENRPIGYMGHVPAAEGNLAAMHAHGEDDPRRGFAKAYMTLAVHGGGVDAAVSSNNLRARHRAGKNARAPQALKPKSETSVAKMVEGGMLLTTLRDVNEGERRMNVRDDKRGDRYF